MIAFNVPYLSGRETSVMHEVLKNKHFSGDGKYTKLCEDFLQTNYDFKKCYLTPSCTAAIEMAALLLDLNANDEIIVPSYTFASCPNPFLIGSAKVVLADCESNYPNISVAHIEKLITSNTKAIMVMHYGGVGCDMIAIKALCKKHNIFLIEDAAQCIGSYYDNLPLGSYGDISVLSFHETKNITSGEGGALIVNNESLINKAEVIRQYGTNRTLFLNGETNHYEWTGLGLALFQSEMNAAFLYSQLNDIEEVNSYRKTLWNKYYELLKTLSVQNTFNLPDIDEEANFNAHTFFICMNDANKALALIQYLNKNNIKAVKHFYPLHLSSTFPNFRSDESYPNATKFSNGLIRLPLHHYLTFNDIELVVARIKEFFSNE